jgi:hypothetical protein
MQLTVLHTSSLGTPQHGKSVILKTSKRSYRSSPQIPLPTFGMGSAGPSGSFQPHSSTKLQCCKLLLALCRHCHADEELLAARPPGPSNSPLVPLALISPDLPSFIFICTSIDLEVPTTTIPPSPPNHWVGRPANRLEDSQGCWPSIAQ